MFKASRLKEKTKNVESHQVKKKKKPESDKAVFGILEEMGRIEMTLPVRTVSEGNCFEAWRVKHARHKAQKQAVSRVLGPIKKNICLPCTVTFVRFAPRELDEHDNLRMAFKYILDGVAAEITGDFRAGKADSNKEFTWQYGQVKSKEYYIKIIIENT